MADWRFVDKKRFRVLLPLLWINYYVVGEKMIKFRKGKIKLLFSGKTWAFGIDTGKIYLLKIQKECYVKGVSWISIYFLCFWIEIDIGR